MAALYEPDAVLDSGKGRLTLGKEAIRALFADFTATGKKFASGNQSPAVISGDLALTSTHLPDGSVTAEVARRQSDCGSSIHTQLLRDRLKADCSICRASDFYGTLFLLRRPAYDGIWPLAPLAAAPGTVFQ